MKNSRPITWKFMLNKNRAARGSPVNFRAEHEQGKIYKIYSFRSQREQEKQEETRKKVGLWPQNPTKSDIKSNRMTDFEKDF